MADITRFDVNFHLNNDAGLIEVNLSFVAIIDTKRHLKGPPGP